MPSSSRHIEGTCCPSACPCWPWPWSLAELVFVRSDYVPLHFRTGSHCAGSHPGAGNVLPARARRSSAPYLGFCEDICLFSVYIFRPTLVQAYGCLPPTLGYHLILLYFCALFCALALAVGSS